MRSIFVKMSDQAAMNVTLLSTPGVVGVYNTSMSCEAFRSNASQLLFKVWPEDTFRYCCEDSTNHIYSLRNFTYGEHGARIISRPYFDLGNVESLSPYWKQYQFWQVPQTQIVLEGLKCEYTDLYKLYTQRFWGRVVKGGAVTALLIILIIQLIVFVFVLFKWAILFRKMREEVDGRERMKGLVKANMIRWWWTKIKLEDWVSDLAHIAMVVVVGNCLIEAVGHSSPITWRPILFYNAAVVYAWLTLLSLISSVLRQLAVSAFDETEDETKWREYVQVDLEKKYLSKDIPVPKDKLKEIQANDLALSRISEDWRWQRVFGQLAVLILVGTYLMFVDDEPGTAMDSIAALVFATLVVACMWSGGVGLVVAGRTLSHIRRHLMTQSLPEIRGTEDIEFLHKIQMEESRIQVSGSQRFNPSSFRRYIHNMNGIAE